MTQPCVILAGNIRSEAALWARSLSAIRLRPWIEPSAIYQLQSRNITNSAAFETVEIYSSFMSCLTVAAMLARRAAEKGEWYPCKRATEMRVLFPNVQRVTLLSEGTTITRVLWVRYRNQKQWTCYTRSSTIRKSRWCSIERSIIYKDRRSERAWFAQTRRNCVQDNCALCETDEPFKALSRREIRLCKLTLYIDDSMEQKRDSA